MSNSSLVSYTRISPNKTSPRNHSIDTITIHCVVGQVTVERLGEIFAPSSRQASSNYGIGLDGKIGMYVEEKDRSWCSSNSTNDNRAITIECASDTTDPYAINDKVYAALIDLCVDICQRNGIKKLVWSTDKNTRVNHLNGCNMTVHRDYAAKSCPGDYIYNRLGQIADEVNARLCGGNTGTTTPPASNTSFPQTPFTVQVTVPDLNIRKGAGTNYVATGKYTGKGTFTITEVKNGWGKLKSGAGWICLENADWVKVNGSASDTSFKVQVSITNLNIRKGPGTNYATNGYCPKGVYTITDTQTAGGYTWGKLKSGAGWIALDYAEKL